MRQYALAEDAERLGWPAERVVVGSEQGQSVIGQAADVDPGGDRDE